VARQFLGIDAEQHAFGHLFLSSVEIKQSVEISARKGNPTPRREQ
jgi:hypothetical protein